MDKIRNEKSQGEQFLKNIPNVYPPFESLCRICFFNCWKIDRDFNQNEWIGYVPETELENAILQVAQ